MTIPANWVHLTTAAKLPLGPKTMHRTIPMGTPFGRLTIDSEPFKLEGYGPSIYYECQCTCGNRRPIRATRLTAPRSNGRVPTTSCGCRMLESSRANGGKNKGSGAVVCACGAAIGDINGTQCYQCRYKKHKVRHKARHKEWIAEQRNTPRRFLAWRMLGTRERLRKSGYDREFTITLDELEDLWEKQNGRCALSTLPMSCEKHSPHCVTMDRIKSDIGYVPGNVQLVCHALNLAKWKWEDAVIRQLLMEMAKSLTNIQSTISHPEPV